MTNPIHGKAAPAFRSCRSCFLFQPVPLYLNVSTGVKLQKNTGIKLQVPAINL